MPQTATLSPYLFVGQDMLACVLRPSDRHPASVASALIKRLLVPLRQAWLKAKIIVRADSGFCRPRVLQRLERWGVRYIIGLQKNSRLKEQVALAGLALADQYAAKQTEQRMMGQFKYAAQTWDKQRRVIARWEPRFARPPQRTSAAQACPCAKPFRYARRTVPAAMAAATSRA